MDKKLHLVLSLICALCFTTCLSAQDTTQEAEKPKVQKQERKKKALKKQKDRIAQRIAKDFKATELTDDQTKQISDWVEENFETLKGIQKKVDGFIGKEEKKTVNAAVKKARAAGTKWPEAMKTAYEEIGLSEEDQESVTALNKERNGMFDEIKKSVVATFSEDQKKAMAATKKKGGKGKGKKGKKEKTETETTSVSVSLPGMT